MYYDPFSPMNLFNTFQQKSFGPLSLDNSYLSQWTPPADRFSQDQINDEIRKSQSRNFWAALAAGAMQGKGWTGISNSLSQAMLKNEDIRNERSKYYETLNAQAKNDAIQERERQVRDQAMNLQLRNNNQEYDIREEARKRANDAHTVAQDTLNAQLDVVQQRGQDWISEAGDNQKLVTERTKRVAAEVAGLKAQLSFASKDWSGKAYNDIQDRVARLMTAFGGKEEALQGIADEAQAKLAAQAASYGISPEEMKKMNLSEARTNLTYKNSLIDNMDNGPKKEDVMRATTVSSRQAAISKDINEALSQANSILTTPARISGNQTSPDGFINTRSGDGQKQEEALRKLGLTGEDYLRTYIDPESHHPVGKVLTFKGRQALALLNNPDNLNAIIETRLKGAVDMTLRNSGGKVGSTAQNGPGSPDVGSGSPEMDPAALGITGEPMAAPPPSSVSDLATMVQAVPPEHQADVIAKIRMLQNKYEPSQLAIMLQDYIQQMGWAK